MKIIIIIVLASFIFLFSCNENSISIKEEKDNILPLSVGNKWIYIIEYSYGQGDTIIWEVLSKTDFNIDGSKVTAYGMNYYIKILPNYNWLFCNGPDGLYALGGISDTDTLIIKDLKLKYPAIEGDSYQVLDMRYSRSDEIFYIKDTITYSVVSTSDTLVTPAGTFSGCYVYNYRIKQADDVSGFDDYYDYFVPRIGLVGTIVRTIVRNEPQDTTLKLLLSNYSIK